MKKIHYLYCTASSTFSRGDGTIKIMLPIKALNKEWKKCYCYTFYNENQFTYLYIICNKKILFVRKVLASCVYSPASPFFLLLSKHKHCDNVATNSNSENSRNIMMASLRVSVGTGTKEDQSSTGRVWAAGFHHVRARSGLSSVLWLMNRLFL